MCVLMKRDKRYDVIRLSALKLKMSKFAVNGLFDVW